jgi:GNAT superfamily N-acetyltransferase
MIVRKATDSDAEQVAQLSFQLGYLVTSEETARRILELSGNSEHAVLVADEGGMLLGWIHVHLAHSLAVDGRVEVAGLVVDENHRGRGVGRVLMERAEIWAREKNCTSVRLRSNVLRGAAHLFYERLGYRETKVQKAFQKQLL